MNDVIHTVTDGLLGLGNSSATGIHIKIGASPIESADPIVITSSKKLDKIHELLGLSPLSDAVMDSLENGSSRIICIPVKPGTDGTIKAGDFIKTETSPTMDMTGKPNNSFSVIVAITGKGILNTASFKYSINGGYTYSDEMSVPLTGEYDIPDTGLKLTFSISDDQQYEVNDTFNWTTTSPKLTNENVIAGINKIKNIKAEAELVHIVGTCGADTWASVSQLQQTLQKDYHKPLMFVLEAFEKKDDESISEYVKALSAARKTVKNYNIQVVTARAMYVGMDSITRDINFASIVCGLYAKTSVSKSIGETAKISISEEKVLKLLPAEMDDDDISELDEIGFLTIRQYDGLSGYYVNNAKVMGPDGSDYRYAEDVRVLNKVIRETRKTALLQLQSDIDLENPQADLQAKVQFIKAPLDDMVDEKEISSSEISVPDDVVENIQELERLYLTVRYVQRGIIRSINIDVGKSNPYAS